MRRVHCVSSQHIKPSKIILPVDAQAFSILCVCIVDQMRSLVIRQKLPWGMLESRATSVGTHCASLYYFFHCFPSGTASDKGAVLPYRSPRHNGKGANLQLLHICTTQRDSGLHSYLARVLLGQGGCMEKVNSIINLFSMMRVDLMKGHRM